MMAASMMVACGMAYIPNAVAGYSNKPISEDTINQMVNKQYQNGYNNLMKPSDGKLVKTEDGRYKILISAVKTVLKQVESMGGTSNGFYVYNGDGSSEASTDKDGQINLYSDQIYDMYLAANVLAKKQHLPVVSYREMAIYVAAHEYSHTQFRKEDGKSFWANKGLYPIGKDTMISSDAKYTELSHNMTSALVNFYHKGKIVGGKEEVKFIGADAGYNQPAEMLADVGSLAIMKASFGDKVTRHFGKTLIAFREYCYKQGYDMEHRTSQEISSYFKYEFKQPQNMKEWKQEVMLAVDSAMDKTMKNELSDIQKMNPDHAAEMSDGYKFSYEFSKFRINQSLDYKYANSLVINKNVLNHSHDSQNSMPDVPNVLHDGEGNVVRIGSN